MNKLLREDSLGVDTETGGLDFRTCDLRLVTICTRRGDVVMVRTPYEGALNLRRLFQSNHINFIFHHAAFDLKFLVPHLACEFPNSFECTKTLSKILEPGERSGLGKVVARTCNIQIDKAIRHTWDEQELSQRQVEYACDDVMYLHEILDHYRPILNDGQHNNERVYYKTALECISRMAVLDITGFANVLYYEDDEAALIGANRKWWEWKVANTQNSLFIRALDETDENKRKYQIKGIPQLDGSWDVFATKGDEDVGI